MSTPARREQLLDAADALVARQGAGASMAAIAAEAGITKPILYRWFGDKAGLYRALAGRHTATLLTAVGTALTAHGDLETRTRRSIDAYLRLVESSPQTYRFLTTGEGATEPGVVSHVRATIDQLADALAVGISYELGRPLPPDVRCQVWARAVVGMVQTAGDWWLDHSGAATREEIAAELTALLMGRFAELAALVHPGDGESSSRGRRDG